jgi:hypothetical protein
MMPCKECLLLPMCKQKHAIDCLYLNDWIKKDGPPYVEKVFYAEDFLKVLVTIFGEGNDDI